MVAAAPLPQVLESSRTCPTNHAYKIWPSDLARAGHTTVSVDDPSEPLYKFFEDLQPHPRYGIRMGRNMKAPCLLQVSSGFPDGTQRWWCPVHQGVCGKPAQLKEAGCNGQKACERADDPVDCVRAADIPIFCLTHPDQVCESPNSYCELGIWIGLPPALDTLMGNRFFPGIHVHARKETGGKKVVDTNFPAVTVRDTTGRFPQLAGEGVTVTSPAALEYLYYMENKCPVNRVLSSGAGAVPRPEVELVADVRCEHCKALHEDIGDHLGGTKHTENLCGQCGRDIVGPPQISNPLVALRREFRREVVGTNIDPQNKELRLNSEGLRLMMWPSTPAIFWSRDAPEIWGVHVHAFDKEGERVIDDTFGEVHLDGKKLDRADLFGKMLAAAGWMRGPSEEGQPEALELEDD